MTVNSWILQLVSLSNASKLSVVFKISGLLVDDPEQKELIVGEEYIGTFLSNCCAMVIHHNSALAQSINRWNTHHGGGDSAKGEEAHGRFQK
jgi:hypothetical protein